MWYRVQNTSSKHYDKTFILNFASQNDHLDIPWRCWKTSGQNFIILISNKTSYILYLPFATNRIDIFNRLSVVQFNNRYSKMGHPVVYHAIILVLHVTLLAIFLLPPPRSGQKTPNLGIKKRLNEIVLKKSLYTTNRHV